MRLAATRSSITSGGGAVLDLIQQEDPSLDLNFAENKNLTNEVDGENLITFSRASSATYVGSDGLIKTTPVNLQFPSTPVILRVGATVTPNAATAPDGTNTATLVEPNGDRHSGVVSGAAVSKTAGVTHVHSFYYKPNGYNVAGFDFSGGNPDQYGEAFVDVTNPTSTHLRSTFTSITATDVGSGWYRITAVQVPSTTGTTANYSKSLVCRPNVPTTIDENYTHTAGSGGYFWGHQEELGSVATTLIPTTSTISGAPRFDHDPATGESLGLLIEEARTNSFTLSEFETGYSLGSSVNGGLLSDTTFDGLFQNTGVAFGHDGSTTSYLYKSGVPSQTLATISVFVRMDDGLAPSFGSSNTQSVLNDFAFVLSGDPVYPPSSYKVEDYGNGLYRVSCTDTSGTNLPNTGVIKYSSNSNRTFKVSGYQVELNGSFPTSYIPTSGSTVTRSADVAQITGADFAKTNLVQYSERFDNAYWTKGSTTVTPNVIAAPDGSLTADKLVETATGPTSHIVYATATTSAGSHVFSVYLKADERSFALLYHLGSNVGAYFNLSDGSITTGGAGIPAASAYSSQDVGNGWYRCSITVTAPLGSSQYRVYVTDSGSSYSYTGNGTSGIYVWGFQLEEGSVLTDYTPSVESFVSRASSATYVDDTTGLIKTTPVNLAANSEEFNQWGSKIGITVTANATTAPDGSTTADKIVGSSGSSIKRIFRGNLGPGTFTASVYLKAAEFDYGYLGIYDGTTLYESVLVDLTDGSFLQFSNNSIPYSIDSVGNGWYRVSITVTTSNAYINVGLTNVANAVPDAGGHFPATGDGTSGIFVWGAQLEEGSTATPYIKTTSTISGAARYENGELILEESRTNYCKDGTGFTVTSGDGRTQPSNGTFSSTTVANPTGETDTVLFTTDAVSGTSIQITGGDASLGNVGNALSVFIKPNGITKIFLTTYATAGNQGAYFELTGNGSVVGVQNNLPSDQYFIEPYPNGWYRLGVRNFARVVYALKIWEYDGGNNPQFNSVTGDGTSGFYIWGWQNELTAPYWSSVIPTSGTAVTRAADVSTSALGVDSWYNQSEGTWFAEASARGKLLTHSVSTHASSYQNSTQFFGSNGETDGFFRIRLESGGVTSTSFPGLTSIVPMQKYAGAYDSQSIQSALQGTTSNSVAVNGTLVSGLTHMYIGRTHYAFPTRHHIKRLSYFPTRLPDATLQDITS